MKEELLKRIQLLQHEVVEKKLDCYIVASEDNIWYLTNITYKPEERPFFIIVSPFKKPVLIVPKLEERHLQKITIDCEIKAYWEYPSPSGLNWYDVLEDSLKGFSRIGVEINMKAEIISRIHGSKVVQEDLLGSMRKIKSPYEIEMIRNSAKIAVQAMGKIFKNAYVGASVVEIFSLSKSIQTELIKSRNFDPIVTSLLTAAWPAPVSAMPHSIPNLDDRMGSGPNVAMCYFRINGYAAECERTFFVMEPSDEQKEHFLLMLEARRRALRILKAGVRCSDVDSEAKDYLIKNGYKDNLLHRTGHGIGLGNHEQPWVAEGSDEILAENMVISIEPGIYIEGLGGFRHSDTYLVTNDGFEVLTKFPISLEDMTIKKSNIMARIKGSVIKKALKL